MSTKQNKYYSKVFNYIREVRDLSSLMKYIFEDLYDPESKQILKIIKNIRKKLDRIEAKVNGDQ